jgi:RimJ/RimL family protein N-acetyltransferase
MPEQNFLNPGGHALSTINCGQYGLALQLLPRKTLLTPIFNLASEIGLSSYMEWVPHRSPADTEGFFAFCAEETRLRAGYHFAIELVSTQEIVGVTSITSIDHRLRRAEVTTWIGGAKRGKGLNYKVKHVLLEFFSQALELNKFVFRVCAQNVSSLRSHLKLGTQLEGVLRQEMLIGGRLYDVHYLALLRDDFLSKYPRLDLGIS